jgi:hypothetical protein
LLKIEDFLLRDGIVIKIMGEIYLKECNHFLVTNNRKIYKEISVF